MLTQEHKERCVQVCQDLLNQYEAEGNSFLDRIIAGDKSGVTTTSRSQNDNQWSGDMLIPIEEKVQGIALSG